MVTSKLWFTDKKYFLSNEAEWINRLGDVKKYIDEFDSMIGVPQNGEETFYPRRRQKENELDINNITLIGHSRGGGIVSIKASENSKISIKIKVFLTLKLKALL